MKKLSLALCALFLTGLAAHADSKEKRWQLQLGVARPLQSSGKTFLGDRATSSILSYDLGGFKDGTWGLFAQGISKSRSYEDSEGGDVNSNEMAGGFGLQYRMRSASNPALYYGVGVGVYSLSTSLSVSNTIGQTTNTNTITTTSSDVLGGRLFVGQSFGRRYFAEVAYTATASPQLGTNKINPSNFSLGVGLRF
jgi:hypothetical protein